MEKSPRPSFVSARREILAKKGSERNDGSRHVYCDSKNCKKLSRWIATIIEDAYGYTVIDGPNSWDEDMWNNDYHPGCPQNKVG